MKILDRYIAKSILGAIALVTLMLAGLQIFILFVNQLDDLGKGGFGLAQAAVYVFLQMPYQVYLFFPMASLLGSLIGLGILAHNSELIVMRAAGLSIRQITAAVLKAAFLLILIVTILGETLIPKMAYKANNYKMSALSGGQTLRTARGVWLRSQHHFISIGEVLSSHQLRQIYQFTFGSNQRLQRARFITELRFEQGHWQAYQLAETRFQENSTSAHRFDSLPWDVDIKPEILGNTGNEPDEMTLKDLKQLIREQKRTNQNTVIYQLAYWQRLIQPFTTVVMMLLAIPFIFGPLRSSTMGAKLLTGATVGFGFYIMNRFLGPISMVYQWPAEWAAIGPSLFFALVGFYLMRRVQ